MIIQLRHAKNAGERNLADQHRERQLRPNTNDSKAKTPADETSSASAPPWAKPN
jgi:hypothetical protein